MKKNQLNCINCILRITLLSILLNACATNLSSVTEDAIEPSETIKIAVLLPFGSKEKRLSYIGKSMRDAALLAKKDLENPNLQLMIYDTKGRVDISLDAASSAINAGAHLIIGPFLTETTKAVSTISKPRKIKMISFANDLTLLGGNTLIIGDTKINRAQNLVKYAIEKNEYRFAIVSPIEDRNSELENAIRSSVRKNGGIVTFTAHYSEKKDSLSNLADEIREKAFSTNTDVIIFADDPNRHITLLTAEISDMTDLKNDEKIQIIGLSRWDLSASILSEPSLQGSWLAIPDHRFRTTFENMFIKQFGYRPHLKSSLAYDAIAAMGVLVRKRDIEQGYYPFTAREITSMSGFIGIDGIFRFRLDGRTEKALAIAEINADGLKILKPAPNKFP